MAAEIFLWSVLKRIMLAITKAHPGKPAEQQQKAIQPHGHSSNQKWDNKMGWGKYDSVKLLNAVHLCLKSKLTQTTLTNKKTKQDDPGGLPLCSARLKLSFSLILPLTKGVIKKKCYSLFSIKNLDMKNYYGGPLTQFFSINMLHMVK